jgi:hypothetical protein
VQLFFTLLKAAPRREALTEWWATSQAGLVDAWMSIERVGMPVEGIFRTEESQRAGSDCSGDMSGAGIIGCKYLAVGQCRG